MFIELFVEFQDSDIEEIIVKNKVDKGKSPEVVEVIVEVNNTAFLMISNCCRMCLHNVIYNFQGKEVLDKGEKKAVRKRKVTKVVERKNQAKGIDVHDNGLPAEYCNVVVSEYYTPPRPKLRWLKFKDQYVSPTKLRPFRFRKFEAEWTFSNSLFCDRGDPLIQKPPLPKRYMYQHRDKISYDVTSILDDWWVEIKQNKLTDSETAFEHRVAQHVYCRVQFIKDLLMPEVDLSSEVFVILYYFLFVQIKC